MTEDNQYTPIDKHMPTTEFIYPDDEKPVVDIEEKNKQFVFKLINHILTRENPVAALVGLAYSCGFDFSYILNCESTVTALAEKLGMTKQRLSAHIVQARQEFNLPKRHKRGKPNEKKSNNRYPRHTELIVLELQSMTQSDRGKALGYITGSLLNL